MSTKTSPLRNSVAVEDYLERILEPRNAKGYAGVVDIAPIALTGRAPGYGILFSVSCEDAFLKQASVR